MSWIEWLVLVLGLGLGYLVVSMLMGERQRRPGGAAPPPSASKDDGSHEELPR